MERKRRIPMTVRVIAPAFKSISGLVEHDNRDMNTKGKVIEHLVELHESATLRSKEYGE